MNNFKLTTPVVFIIFNRPDTAEKVFSQIAKVKPQKLLVIGDGARPAKDGEIDMVMKTRAILKKVDWECEVITNFSTVNLGCMKRVSSGLDWVFSLVEEAIILEDDCLPDISFFRFCQELLEKYRLDNRISMIGGSNFQGNKKYGNGSYYYSRYAHIWGWATWSRAWKKYDVNAAIWPEFYRENCLNGLIKSRDEQRHWIKVFFGVFKGDIDTWDYQWVLTAWSQGWLSIIPNTNLISNIGFGAGATHTTSASLLSNMPAGEMSFPLEHPKIFLPAWEADEKTGKDQYISSIFRKIIRKLKTACLN